MEYKPIISVLTAFWLFCHVRPLDSKYQNTRLNLQRFPAFIVKSFSLNTSFSVLLTALYRVSMCLRIGCFESSQDVCNIYIIFYITSTYDVFVILLSSCRFSCRLIFLLSPFLVKLSLHYLRFLRIYQSYRLSLQVLFVDLIWLNL